MLILAFQLDACHELNDYACYANFILLTEFFLATIKFATIKLAITNLATSSLIHTNTIQHTIFFQLVDMVCHTHHIFGHSDGWPGQNSNHYTYSASAA